MSMWITAILAALGTPAALVVVLIGDTTTPMEEAAIFAAVALMWIAYAFCKMAHRLTASANANTRYTLHVEQPSPVGARR